MDTTTPPTTTVTVKTDDPDHEIQHQLRPTFTNGILKRQKPQQQQLQLHPHNNNLVHHPVLVMKYKECLKNHAASIGKHAVDGCCEFMPSLTSLPTDPTSLTCAACGCHRNFHRREPDAPLPFLHNPPSIQHHLIEYQPHHRHRPPPPQPPPPPPVSVAGVKEINETSQSPADSRSPPPISSSYYPSAPHMLLALSSGSRSNRVAGKKRFRTIFSEDQKVKMREMAERVEWKMQKKDEGVIVGFCNEVGVDKGVFRIWMHNNKVTLGGKKDSGSGSSGGGGGVLMNRDSDQQQRRGNDGSFSSGGGGDGGGGGGGNIVGSSSSS